MKEYNIRLSAKSASDELQKLGKNWRIVSDKKLQRIFKFDSFIEAIYFITKIAQVSETINHHPDIYIFYDQVKIEISTHVIKGLTKLDFILAERIENDFQKQRRGRKDVG